MCIFRLCIADSTLNIVLGITRFPLWLQQKQMGERAKKKKDKSYWDSDAPFNWVTEFEILCAQHLSVINTHFMLLAIPLICIEGLNGNSDGCEQNSFLILSIAISLSTPEKRKPKPLLPKRWMRTAEKKNYWAHDVRTEIPIESREGLHKGYAWK